MDLLGINISAIAEYTILLSPFQNQMYDPSGQLNFPEACKTSLGAGLVWPCRGFEHEQIIQEEQ